MSRDLILGKLDPDLACAIALGVVEYPPVVALLESVTLHDAHMMPIGTQSNWLTADDPLDIVTSAYLQARREAMATTTRRPGAGWAAASAAKVRDIANQLAAQAKMRGRALLAERGILTIARESGLTVLE